MRKHLNCRNLIPIQIVTPASDIPVHTPTTIPSVRLTEEIPPRRCQSGSGTAQDGLAPILNPILRAITSILSKLVSPVEFMEIPGIIERARG